MKQLNPSDFFELIVDFELSRSWSEETLQRCPAVFLMARQKYLHFFPKNNSACITDPVSLGTSREAGPHNFKRVELNDFERKC